MQFTQIKTLRILTILLSLSLAVVSVAGAFLPGTYERDSASMGAQGMGQDLVDLFLVVPLLLLTFYLAAKGSRKAALIYAGVLGYIMYSFVIYCLGVYFNRYFLLYCLTLSLSLYAFILVFSDLKQQKMETWFTGIPVKWIAGYLILVALVFYMLWLRSVVPAILQNEIPQELKDNKLLVNPVHVIDMVFALPAIIVGAVLLWQKNGVGYLITALALVFMIILTLALAGMVLMLTVKGISEDHTIAIVFAVLCLISLVFLFIMFRGMKPGTSS